MSGWKYIMLPGKMGMQQPIIFPDTFVHQDVAEVFFCNSPLVGREVISAGFVDGLSVVATSGHSESLDLKARGEDASIINVHPYTKGLVTDDSMNLGVEILLLEKTLELLQMRVESLKRLKGVLGAS